MKKWLSEILKRPITKRQVLYASMMLIGAFFAAAALRMILSDTMEDTAARVEYLQLREAFPEVSRQPVLVEDEDEEIIPEEEEDEFDLRNLSLDELAAINRDFIGWINAGNAIDYPVVRGNDNTRYIDITFFGSRNSAGTIFMDYRNSGGFDEHVAILYGHFTRDGSMFSALINYLNPGYRRSNPNINITTRDGRNLTYRVFAAVLTDAWDNAYTVGIRDSSKAAETFPDAPNSASRFLLLSTCTRSRDENERVLVFAALS
ncbi:MAG: class B sortase [Oscillospiraceae bacterium]|nr:class B sortase [Oscillospiraceae bacterium]